MAEWVGRTTEDAIPANTTRCSGRSDVGKARLRFAKEIRDLLLADASLGGKEQETKLPRRVNTEEADKLISKLEAQRGAPLSEVCRGNLRSLCALAGEGRENLKEKMGVGVPFEGGDDVRNLVAWKNISTAAEAGKLPDGCLKLLDQPDGVSSLRSLTQLSHDMNYIADKSHAPDFYREHVLSGEGMAELQKKAAPLMDAAVRDMSILEVAVKESKELEKTKKTEKELNKEGPVPGLNNK